MKEQKKNGKGRKERQARLADRLEEAGSRINHRVAKLEASRKISQTLLKREIKV